MSRVGFNYGKTTKNVEACDAYAHIFGILLQMMSLLVMVAISYCYFPRWVKILYTPWTPIGPWIVTADEVLFLKTLIFLFRSMMS